MASIPMVGLLPKSEIGRLFLSRNFPGSRVQKVSRVGEATVGQCYQNVRAHVTQLGGSIQLGWILCWWPGHLVEALHHAVWRDPKGNLLDITAPAYPTMTGKNVFFIEDNSTPIDDLDPAVPSKFSLLIDNEALNDYAIIAQARMKLIGMLHLKFKEVGYTISMEGIVVNNLISRDVIEIQNCISEYSRALAAYNDKFSRGDLTLFDT